MFEINHSVVFLFVFSGHRFDIPKGKRRFNTKSKASIVSAGPGSKSSTSSQPLPIYSYKKVFDHSPHKVNFTNFLEESVI